MSDVMTDNRKIVIDCDPGTDDALALLLASVYFGEQVICLVSTYGNVPLYHTHANLKGLAALLGMEQVPIVCGASHPLGKTGFVSTDYHGGNGLCDIRLPLSSNAENEEVGLDRLYELIMEGEKVTYAAFGPLTNLAELLRRHPDAAERIERTVIMGGGVEIGNTACGAEYNFSLDPEAVAVVFESPLKITLASLDFTHTLAFSENELEEIIGASREALGQDETSVYHIFGRIFYGNLESSLRNGNEGAIIHDGAAAAYLCPGISCEAAEKCVRSDHMGRLLWDREGRRVEMLSRMDKSALADLMKEGFRLLRERGGMNE